MFASALAALGTLSLIKTAKADGIQLVTNHGQIVSTGNVNVRQAAGGYQVFDTTTGQWTAVQGVENGLQVVATGNVNADQSAAGTQFIQHDGGNESGVCSPGEYYEQDGCVIFCGEDGCSWYQHCCQSCPKPKGKCCK